MIAWVAVVSLALLYFWFKWSCATQIMLPFTDLAITAQTERTAQIFASLFVCFGVIIAIAQYLIASDQSKKLKKAQIEDVKTRRTQKAIEQAGFYKDQIIGKISIISAAYSLSGIKRILDEIKPEAMLEFDEAELRENLSKAKIEDIQKRIRSTDFIRVLGQVDLEQDCFNLNNKELEDQLKRVQNDLQYDDAKNDVLNIRYRRAFACVTATTLNDLESFAMHFVNDAADEDVVFQSLHQTYLHVVGLLYFNICMNNSSYGVDKYYVNVASLYNTWSKRVKDKQKKLLEHSRKVAK